jgi:HTH-type transcriptional repressor of NAD biosynthesis genes
VVGKFCPLHRGHEFLVEHGIAACDELLIISYSKPEFNNCGREVREDWLNVRFPTLESLVIDDGYLRTLCKERGLPCRRIPHNDAPDDVHRKFVGWLCWTVLEKTVDVVLTSEDYGDGLAAALADYFSERSGSPACVNHVCLDKRRVAVPVSGTAIRSDPHGYRLSMSSQVYASYVGRVCILGGESTGKTTFTEALAKHLTTRWVAEFGRELWDIRNGNLTFPDMLKIAREQVEREKSAAAEADRWLICDTSPLTTLFYSLAMFGQAEAELYALAQRQYAFVFLCAPDFPFVQDGTRRDSEFRDRQHEWYVSELETRGIPYVVLLGSLQERLNMALDTLSRSP